LNGDIIVWNELLGRSFELSSMGIRVNKDVMQEQLRLTGKEERSSLYFHQRVLNDMLPLCIGGGIGQSRLCMLFLKKAHIGEIQASIWPEETRIKCKEMNIPII
jgi:aspartate--ammonia ligase